MPGVVKESIRKSGGIIDNPILNNYIFFSKLQLATFFFDFVDLSVECFEKSRRGRPLLPLQSLHGFEIIYQGPSPQARVGQRRTSSSSPIRSGTHSSPTRSTSRAFLKDSSSPGGRISTRENIFVSRSLSKEKNESILQRAATETLALFTVKEDVGNHDAAAGKANNGYFTSDEDAQENANERTEDAEEKDMNEKRRKKETRRNIPKATRTSFDSDSEASKTGGRVRSIQNDLSLQGRSKKVLTKESAKPLPVPLTGQSNSASGIRKSAFPPLIEYSSSPYSSKQSTTDVVKLRMSHGANTPVANRSKSRAKELEVANRGS